MTRINLKHFKKAAEITAALLSVVVLLVAVIVFVVFWKLSHGPVDMTWAQPYIQKALAEGRDDVEVKAEGLVAEWKSFHSPLTLGIANLSISEKNVEVLTVSEAGLQLAKVPLFLGIVLPESIYIKNPAMRFEKSADGSLSFLISNKGDVSKPKAIPDNAKTRERASLQEIADSIFLGGFLSGKSSLPLSRLESFIIENATISIYDEVQQKEFALPDANMTLRRDFNNFSFVLDYQAKEGDRSKINAVVVRKPLSDEIKFLIKLHKVETGLWALHMPRLPGLMREDYTFNGQISGIFDSEWTFRSLGGEISTSQGEVEKQSFRLSAIRDAQTGIIPVELSLASISLDQIASVWPEELKDHAVGEWFTKKLSKGVINDLKVRIPFKNEKSQWVMAGDPEGSFDFTNLTCDYRAPLIPITEGDGHAVIADDTLTITIDKAKLDNMDIKSGSSVTITKLSAGAHEVGEAIVKVDLTGPLSTALKYIALEPISLGSKLKTDPAKVEGRADAHVTVTFPTLADLLAEQVAVVVDATLTDTKLPGLVHGMDITGGPLTLKVDEGAFAINGNGALDGVPLEFTYSEYIDPATAPYAADLKARLVTTDALRAKFGINISDYVSGSLPVDVAYQDKNDGTTEIDIKADLTPARVFVTPLNYFKKEGVAGEATTHVSLKAGEVQKIKDLNVTIGKDKATNGQLTFGTIGKENDVVSASFDNVKLGAANDMALNITQSASVLKVVAKGNSLDGRAFMKGSQNATPEAPAALPSTKDIDLSVETKAMRMGDKQDQFLTSPKLAARINPAGQLKSLVLTSKAGSGDFAVNLSPGAKGVMNLRMDSNDAGAALNAIGIYEDMRGGTLALSGFQLPDGEINDISGAAVITNFRIVKAPALAQLIGAFSITGLPELLANDGISFSKLRSDFVWKQSKQGRIINLYNGATGGGSVGLTFGGIINQSEGTMDISGTFVPISQINKIVSSIPIVGQLLTGGKNGGIIAATYSMKGPTENPSLMINPLSVLAPGFLRSILFEGGLNSGKDERPSEPKNKVQPERTRTN